jgi:L-lactate utilization protein LutC
MTQLHTRHFTSVLGALLATVSFGCAQKPVEHTVRKITPETVAAAADHDVKLVKEAVENRASQDGGREEFRQKLAMKLEQFDRHLEDMRMKVAKLEASAKAEWEETISALAAERDAVQARIEDAMKATSAGWNDLRDHAHDAWDELEKAARKAEKAL